MSGKWVTHKFGGTSLATSGAFGAVRDILLAPAKSRQAVVVSATTGVTDDLIDLAAMAGSRDPAYGDKSSRIREKQAGLIKQLVPGEVGQSLLALVDEELEEIKDLLKASWGRSSVHPKNSKSRMVALSPTTPMRTFKVRRPLTTICSTS